MSTNINVFTEQEKEALQKFRPLCSDLGLNEEQQSDFFLIRWLRARELDLNKAHEMLQQSLKWRKDNDMDNILNWEAPKEFQRDFAYDVDGEDLDGSPVFIVPYGRWDVRAAVQSGQKDIYLRYFTQLCERAIDIMKKKNKNRPANDPVTQVTVVWDMTGFSMKQITTRGTVDGILESVRVMESNYPELMKCSFTINAPRIFALLFALVKPMLTPRTLAKVQLYGPSPNKWKSGLLKIIPADQLLPQYGGTRAPSQEFSSMAGEQVATEEEGDGMCVVTVDAGDTLNIQLDIKHPNSTLHYAFRTDDFDIGFGLYNDQEQIFAHERVDSHLKKQEGSHVCAKAGRYTLAFDNSYSQIRSKTLYYSVSVSSPENDDDDVNTF